MNLISVCEAIQKKQKNLVKATGTGKTRTSISVVDVLTRQSYVKNILFLAYRKALVKQAKSNFSKLLPDLALYNLLDNKDNSEEKSKFWQMKGRGTRLCPDLLGVGIDTEKFLVFD